MPRCRHRNGVKGIFIQVSNEILSCCGADTHSGVAFEGGESGLETRRGIHGSPATRVRKTLADSMRTVRFRVPPRVAGRVVAALGLSHPSGFWDGRQLFSGAGP